MDELIRPMKGLYSLLQALKGKNVSLACLTNDEHRRAQAILEFLKISEFFQLILGGNEVNRPKPDPEMIEAACQKAKASSPPNCLHRGYRNRHGYGQEGGSRTGSGGLGRGGE